MPPRVLGPSARVPGAFDVEREDGEVFAVTPEIARGLPQAPAPDPEPLGGFGAGAPMANADDVLPIGVGAPPPGAQTAAPPQPRQRAPMFSPQSDVTLTPSGEVISNQPAGTLPIGIDQRPIPTRQERIAGAIEQGQAQAETLRAQQASQDALAPGAVPAAVYTEDLARENQDLSGIQSGDRISLATDGAAPPAGQSAGGGVDPVGQFVALRNALGSKPGRGGPSKKEVTTQKQTTKVLTDNQEALLQQLGAEGDVATADLVESVGRESEARAGSLEQAAEIREKLAQDLEQKTRDRAFQEEARQIAIANTQDKIAKLQQDIATKRVDPNRHFRNRGTAAQIGAAISVALGAFVQGARGGENSALQIVNDTIERDLQAQREDIINQRASIGDLRGILSETRARFENDRAAEEAARSALFTDAAQRVEAVASQAQSVEAREKGLQFAAQLRAQSAESERNAILAAAPTIEQETTTTRRSGGGGGTKGVSDATLLQLMKMGNLEGMDPKEQEAQTRELANRLSKNQVNQFDQAVAAYEKADAASRGDFSRGGITGSITEALPDFAQPETFQELRSSADRVVELILRDESGAVIGPEEKLAKRKQLRIGPEYSAEDNARGIARAKAELRAKEAEIRSGFSERINALQKQRLGQTSANSLQPKNATQIGTVR